MTEGLATLLPHIYTFAGEPPAEELPLDQYDSNIGSLVTIIIVLIFIIGLIILLVRFLAYKNHSWFHSRSVRHLGGVGVGQNKSVQLIKIGNRVYIVGVGDDVSLLDKIEDEDEIDSILASFNASSAVSGKGLFSVINKWVPSRKRSTASKEETMSPEAGSFQELFHSKMQQFGGRRAKLQELLDDEEQSERNKP